jgi:hypothetical protein
MRRLSLVPALLLLVLLAACGGGGGENSIDNVDAFPIAGNSELVVGPNRFAVALIDQATSDPVLEASGTSVHLNFLRDDEPQFDTDTTFVWAIPDSNGFWTAEVNFDQPGTWSLAIDLTRAGKALKTAGASFTVLAESRSPNIGDPAPASENLTFASEPNTKRVTTDTDPDPALYQLTVAEALQQHKPLVITFATPAYCQTRFCGPVVDSIKAILPQFADQVNFIHIEPFVLGDDGHLVVGTQGAPATSQPMLEWNLRSEPWVFVVNADGRIASRFEGAVSTDELRQAIEGVLS